MLYYFFRELEKIDFWGTAMWSSVSFRAIAALVLSFICSLILGQYFIKFMRRKGIGETARDAAIDPFGESKKGVPSMGGIIIIVSILVACLLLGRLRNIYLILMLVATVGYALIGFMDDYIKIFRRNKEGLAGRWKLLGQTVMGLIIGLTIYWSPDAVIHENMERQRVGNKVEVVHKSEAVKSTITTIPFFKANNADYSVPFAFLGKYQSLAGWMFFVFVVVFITTALSNGANLNDGMDGMAAGNALFICFALGILAYVSSHIEFASYLNIMYIPGTQELVVYICAMLGALLGFLWYNAYPAQVFMGDTGALAIGGILGAFVCIIHKELLVPLLCFVFFIETLSVFLQTFTFKIGKRFGKRIRLFRAAPIHDAFRRLDSQLDTTSYYVFRGWPKRQKHEAKITLHFWIVTIITAALAILTLKIR